jgi:hypothetical protein
MAATTSDYVSVHSRSTELGCIYPTSGLSLLPDNFATAKVYEELRQQSEAASIRTLFRTHGIPLSEILPSDKRVPYIQNNSYEWVGPALFVSAALISEDASAVSIALGVLSNYLTDFFKGVSGRKSISLDVVVERTTSRSCKLVSYKGDIEGLKSLAEVIKAVSDD